MSKVVMSLPKSFVRHTLMGGVVALTVYTLLQMVTAGLVEQEILGVDGIYPAVCVTAALASFFGCGYGILRTQGAAILSASSVVVVFLAVTVATGLLFSENAAVGSGFVGVGLAMALGGLAAAVCGSLGRRRSGKASGRRRRKGRGRA